MSWIKIINYKEADAQLKRIYNKVKGPNDNIDNVLSVHSLRPHTLTGHMSLYKNVLHNSNNKIPKWFLETIGVYVSFLNGCNYCVEHHFTGLKRLLNDDMRSEHILNGIKNDSLGENFEDHQLNALVYSKKITLDEIASEANLSSTAFCRYFKSRTNKTFVGFLNEIRIGNACKLLMEKEKSASEICYESGFNNLTNFNIQFRKIKGLTPLQYQSQLGSDE